MPEGVLADYRRLKPEEKAELYHDFRKVGGKVVRVEPRDSEEAQKKINNFVDSKDYDKEAAEKEKENIRRKRLAAARLAEEQARREQSRSGSPEVSNVSTGSGTAKKAASAPKPKRDVTREEAVKSFAAYWARLRCVFAGIIRLFDDKFTRGFFHSTLQDLYRALGRIQSILVSALHQDPLITEKIQEKLESIGRPYYYELVWRLDQILEPALFGTIEELKTWKKQVKQGKYPLRELYKKLYALKKYVPVLKHALDNLLVTEAQVRKLRPDVVKSNLKFLEKNIDYVFDVYYPKIDLLMNFYYKIRLYFNPAETFEGFLVMEKADVVGYYTQLWREQKEYEQRKRAIEETMKREEQTENKKKSLIDRIKENDSLADVVKEGLQSVYDEVDFERMKSALEENKDPIAQLDVNDKVFLIFTLIEHFYRQYSFLFLSGQVNYNVFFDKNGSRVDLKNTMKDLYYRMNSIYQRIREYTKVISDLKRFTSNFNIEVDDTMPEMKKLLNQRIDVLRIVNYETRQRMEQFSKVFYYIVRDYVSKNEVLQNGGDFLDLKILDNNGKPKPQKRIFQLFRDAYNFSMAFYFLLTDGDLNTAEFILKDPEYLKLPVPAEEEPAPENVKKSENNTGNNNEIKMANIRLSTAESEPVDKSAETDNGSGEVGRE